MRTVQKYLAGLLFILLIQASLGTRSQERPTTWSLQTCIRYAGAHNIDLGKLRLQALSAGQDLQGAEAAIYPSLSGSMTNTFNNANATLAGSGTLLNQTTSSGLYSVNSSVILWNGGYIRNNIRQRELLEKTAGFGVEAYMNNISILITQYYLTVLLAKENRAYVAELVNTSGARVQQGRQLFDAGSIARKDLLQLEAQLAGDEYLLVQTENEIRQDLLSLRQVLQIPGDSAFDILTPDTVIVPERLSPLMEVKETALRTFPDIKADSLGMGIASLDIEKARSGFYPALSLNGGLGSGYASVMYGTIHGEHAFSTQLGDNLYARLGLAVSIPMYSNRVNRTNLEKAKLAYREAGLTLEGSRLKLAQTVEQAYLGALNALRSYEAAKKQYEAASESYRIMNEQFKLGGVNTYDLLLQRNQYLLGVQAMNQAKYTAVLQQKVYEFYKGIPMDL
jgi:outer membrane protein